MGMLDGWQWGVEMGGGREVQCGRFNERWMVVLKEGESLLRYGHGIHSRPQKKLEENSFPAIHFPFRFPRPYLSPYLSLWGPSGTDPHACYSVQQKIP
jgi:hypothetical protein